MMRTSAAITPSPEVVGDERTVDPIQKWKRDGDALIAARENAKRERQAQEQAQLHAAAARELGRLARIF